MTELVLLFLIGLVAIVSLFFLRAHNRLMKANEDLTSQLVALKNPWAAEMYGRMRAAERVERMDPNRTQDAEEGELLG